MRWVKSSELLPPIGKDCNLKIDNMPFSGRYWDAESEHMSHLTYQHFNVAGKTILDSQHFHRIYWLDESPSGEGDAVDGWISVEDRLPELTEPLIGYNDDNIQEVFIENYEVTVLAYEPTLGVFKARRNDRGWYEISSISSKGVNPTHWKYLPKPPIK